MLALVDTVETLFHDTPDGIGNVGRMIGTNFVPDDGIALQTLFGSNGSQGNVGAESDGEVMEYAQDKVGGERVDWELQGGLLGRRCGGVGTNHGKKRGKEGVWWWKVVGLKEQDSEDLGELVLDVGYRGISGSGNILVLNVLYSRLLKGGDGGGRVGGEADTIGEKVIDEHEAKHAGILAVFGAIVLRISC